MSQACVQTVQSKSNLIENAVEGIEGATVNINSGSVTIHATDDGINAANSDLTDYDYALNINGGSVYIDVSNGDAIDSNGSLTVTGGTVEAYGAAAGQDGSPIDLDGVYTITNGTSPTTFSPDAACTRAQIVTFLWRAAGCPEVTAEGFPFADVPSNSYYYKAVAWAVANGITTGTSATTFSPDAVCTRAQAVTFLYRYAGGSAGTNLPFADVASGAYYADAVSWAVSVGVTKGTSATTFSPDAICTRAQIVTLLYRLLA